MSNHDVIKWGKVSYHLFVYKESKSPAFTATVTSWLLIMTHMTHHRDQWVTSYKMNTMTSWLRHHFRSLPVWSWPEMIFMGFSERRIFYWLNSHKKFLDITYRFSKTIAKLLLALKKMDLRSLKILQNIFYQTKSEWLKTCQIPRIMGDDWPEAMVWCAMIGWQKTSFYLACSELFIFDSREKWRFLILLKQKKNALYSLDTFFEPIEHTFFSRYRHISTIWNKLKQRFRVKELLRRLWFLEHSRKWMQK